MIFKVFVCTSVSLWIGISLSLIGAPNAAAQEPSGTETYTDILAHFPVAKVSPEATTLPSLSLESQKYFPGGWFETRADRNGQTYRWMGARAGAIDIPLVSPKSIRIRLGMGVPQGAGVPAQRASCYFNGEFVARLELDQPHQDILLVVPAATTRAGWNRLEILPGFWVNTSRLAGGTGRSNTSIRLTGVTVESIADPAQPVVSPAPSPSDYGIEQTHNSVISFFEMVPATGKLIVSGRWSGIPDPHAEAVLILTGEEGQPHELLRIPGTQSGIHNRFVELPRIDSSKPRFAEVSLVVRSGRSGSAPPATFAWRQLAMVEPGEPQASLRRDAPEQRRPNIVLCVFDTLRADHLAPYGSTAVSTPNFTQLAERGVVCTSAVAHTSWTRPSIASLLTSLYETTHGVVTMEHALPATVPYLPELLQSAGYHTIGISLNGHIAAQWGFARGFDTFTSIDSERQELMSPPEPGLYADKLWERYVAPELRKRDQPFFLYLHEIDPHGPYTPPSPFEEMYPSHYPGRPEVEAEHIALVRTGLMQLAPEDISFLASRYRGEVSFVDAVLGALAARLDREGLASDTLVLAVSDHGEEFGEHGGIGHSVTLYDEMLRVPMIWNWPGRIPAGHRVDAPIGLVDVVPTVLSMLGLTTPPALHGEDMSGALAGSAVPTTRPVFAFKHDLPGRDLQSVRIGPWKLIERRHATHSNFDLYNTEEEPSEVTNVWISQPIVGESLRQALAWHRQVSIPVDAVHVEALDPELVEQLRNLGYVQ